MRAALFNSPLQLEIVEYSLRKPNNKEILVNVELCGLCGTDFHIFHGESYSKPPLILGHEYVGTVKEVGKEVNGIKVGDHVAVDPNIYCGECYYCRNGKINFCSNLKAMGVSLNGGFAEYSIVPASQAHLIPENFPFNSAVFAEPLSCCVRGIDRAAIKHGESVIILGGGTIGLLMLQLVKISGAGKIIVIEPVEEKRNLARKLGADYVFDPGSQNLLDEINSLTSGGSDVVIECVGKSSVANMAVNLPKRGGRVIIFGLSGKKNLMTVNLQDFFLKELTIKGSLLNPFTFSRAIELLVSKKIQAEKLQPEVASLENLKDILLSPRKSSVIKYQITPN